MPESQEIGPLQNAPAPSGQMCGKTFGRNHLWLPAGPARPGPGGTAPPGPHAPAEVPFQPRAPLRSGPRCQPGGAAPALWLALRWLSPPPALLPPASSPWHGCHTEPLNSHRSPRLLPGALGRPCPRRCPGRAAISRPPSNSPRHRFPASAKHSYLSGALRPPDPRWQLRCGGDRSPHSRCPSPAREANSPLRAARATARLPHLAPGPRSSRPPSPPRPRPVRPGAPGSSAGPRLSESRGGAAPRVWNRAAPGQLLPPRAVPPPSRGPASAAAVSPAPRAGRPRCPRHPLGGRTGLEGPDVCGRLSLAPAPSPALPPRPPHMHLLRLHLPGSA